MATTLDSYSESNQTEYQAIVLQKATSEQDAGGQSFTTPNDGTNYYLDSCKFQLRRNGAITGTIIAYLYAHSGTYGTSSVPTGSALDTSTTTLDASTVATSETLYTFNFAGAVQMTANTNYCILLINTSPGGSGNVYVGMTDDNTSPSHAGNSFYRANSVWTADATRDLSFYVYGNAPASGPANLKTVDGLAKASVKTVNGLAIASVKTALGLA